DRLRFDFSHVESVTPEQLATIESQVNDKIRENIEGRIYERSYDEAEAEGALAFFGEKYGSVVRGVRFGDYSVELCGGTHAAATGELGFVKVTEERGVSAGTRRIEAVSGQHALAYVQSILDRQTRLSRLLKAAPAELEDKLDRVLRHVSGLEKQLETAHHKLAANQGADLADSAIVVGDAQLLVKRMDGADRKTLRETVDALKSKLPDAVVVLASVEDSKVALIAGVAKSNTAALSAGELVNFVAEQVGGKGGGRPDMAQAGGSEPENLDAALATVKDWVAQRL